MTRRRVLGGAVLATAVTVLAARVPAARAGNPPVGSEAVPRRADADRVLADSLGARLGRLETALGLTPPHGPHAGSFRARYAALGAREEAVARRADALLRYVPSVHPVSGGVITSAFSPGRYHPIKLRVIPHVGLDIAAPQGAPVLATADGTVYATVEHPTYGLTVDLVHGSSGFVTRYAHMSSIAVHPGDVVRRGDKLGAVGSTGLSTGLSTGPHTHYEVFYRGWRRDPIDFLPPGAVAADLLLGAD